MECRAGSQPRRTSDRREPSPRPGPPLGAPVPYTTPLWPPARARRAPVHDFRPGRANGRCRTAEYTARSRAPRADEVRPAPPLSRPWHTPLFVAFVLLLATLAACTRTTSRVVDTARITAADSEPANWLTHGRTYSEQRYSPHLWSASVKSGNCLPFCFEHDPEVFNAGAGSLDLDFERRRHADDFFRLVDLDGRAGHPARSDVRAAQCEQQDSTPAREENAFTDDTSLEPQTELDRHVPRRRTCKPAGAPYVRSASRLYNPIPMAFATAACRPS